MKIIRINKTGYYHTMDGIPNQDSVLSWIVTGNIIGIAVADGCSGAVWSNIGSSAVVNYLSYLFRETRLIRRMERFLQEGSPVPFRPSDALFDERYSQALTDMLCDGLKGLIQHLLEKFRYIGNLYGGLKPEDFATTLTLLFLEKGSGRITSVGVGDSFAWIKENDRVHYLDTPENKRSLSQTFFITDSDFKNHLRVNRYNADDFDFIIVSTDGLTKLHKDLNVFLQNIRISETATSDTVRQIFLEDKPCPDDIGFALIINDDDKETED